VGQKYGRVGSGLISTIYPVGEKLHFEDKLQFWYPPEASVFPMQLVKTLEDASVELSILNEVQR